MNNNMIVSTKSTLYIFDIQILIYYYMNIKAHYCTLLCNVFMYVCMFQVYINKNKDGQLSDHGWSQYGCCRICWTLCSTGYATGQDRWIDRLIYNPVRQIVSMAAVGFAGRYALRAMPQVRRDRQIDKCITQLDRQLVLLLQDLMDAML